MRADTGKVKIALHPGQLYREPVTRRYVTMRQLFFPCLLAASLLFQPLAAAAQEGAQDAGSGMSRLSLEALTAAPAEGGGGYRRHPARRIAYRHRPHFTSHAAYWRGRHRYGRAVRHHGVSYARAVYR